jgi:hypothetical protein
MEQKKPSPFVVLITLIDQAITRNGLGDGSVVCPKCGGTVKYSASKGGGRMKYVIRGKCDTCDMAFMS